MKSIDIPLSKPTYIPCFSPGLIVANYFKVPSSDMVTGEVLDIEERVRVYRGRSILDVALSGDGITIIPKKVGTAFVEITALGEADRLRVNVINSP